MFELFNINNNSHMAQWDDFVSSHPEGTPFHLSCWLRTIHDTFAYEPLLYALKAKDGQLAGVFPCFKVKSFLTGSRMVSLPFSDYGGPIFNDERQEQELIEAVVKECRKPIGYYIEIKCILSCRKPFAVFRQYLRHKLKLSGDLEVLRQKMDKRSVQFSIRKAIKKGVKIRRSNDLDSVLIFYGLYKKMRKKIGMPALPPTFFYNLYKHAFSQGNAFILQAFHNDIPIAAILFLSSNNTLYYKYNASDERFLRELTPNHLLLFSAIMDGWKEGFQYVDFGRTSIDNLGLVRFKEQWGAEPLACPHYFFPKLRGPSIKRNIRPFRILLAHAWRWIPDKITDRLNPIIAGHLG